MENETQQTKEKKYNLKNNNSIGGNEMITKKDFLDYAFESAITSMNYNSLQAMSGDIAEEVIATGMQAYAKDQGLTFTDEEVHATIVAGIESLNNAGADFKLQTWMMK